MPLPTYELFDRAEWDKLMAQQLQPHVEAFFTNGGSLAAGRAEALGIVGAFDVSNPKVREFIERYTFDRIKDINDTTAARLRDIMAEGMEAGESIPQLRNRILADELLGSQATPYRAEMIARTEAARAQIEGARSVYQESNRLAAEAGVAEPFEEFMVFVASPDCCDECAAMNGTRVPMGAALDLVHPNCRCDWEPVISEAYAG